MNESEAMWNAIEEIWPSTGVAMMKLNLTEQLETLERDSIVDALRACEGNRTKAAAMLCIGRTNLIAKMRKYDLD